MYAVEKLGSYISRGVYTVSGPFHPFGGAVDIIVVQQQDGSFKSSPWYVRFGKFQGVLKTKEKLVKISVNGVEAGFNMYLDHKGEAFFLRDAEAGEQEFFMSPPISGDETEGTMKNYESEKTQNFDAEGAQKEVDTQVDNGNSKLVTQTSSKRSTILGFVFGRKTFKEIHVDENVKEVNSMERAEISADLLEVKWSMSMTSRDQRVDEVKSPDNGEMSGYVSNEDYSPMTPFAKDCLHPDENLNSYDEGMDNGSVKTISTGDNLEELKHRVGEEPADVYSSEGGKKSTCERKNSEFVSESCGNDPQIANFSFVGISPDSFVSHSNGLRESMNNKLSGIISEEMVSRGEVQIETMGINDTDADARNELIPDLVAVQSDETGVQNSSSTACCDDEMQGLTESLMDSTSAVSTLETGNREVGSFCYWQTIEGSTNRPNITDYKITEDLGPVSGGFKHCEDGILSDATNMVLEVSSIAGAGATFSYENSEYNHDQSLEAARKSESSLSENSQYDSPIEEDLIYSDNNGFGTISYPTSCFKQISGSLPFSLNQQIPACESEVISVDAVAGESSHFQEMNFQKIGLLGNHSCMEETETAQVASCLASVPSNRPKYRMFTKSASISKLLNSCNSDNAAQEVEGFDQKCNLTTVYLEDINFAQDLRTITKPKEVAEYNVSHSENSDDVQFPFSDIDNLGAKEINPELSDNEKIGETKDSQSPNAEIDLKTQDLEIKNNNSSCSNSGAFSSQSSPIVILNCKRCSGVNELSSKSLPIVRSHIDDLEVSALHHSLSCSMLEKNDIQEAVISSDSKEELKNSSKNVTVEVSLCKHLLFEGMGNDAARQLFDAEKVNVEKFIALGPTVVKDERLVVRIGDQYFPWSAAAPIVLGMICFGQKQLLEPQGMIPVDRAEKTLGASKSMPIQPRGNWNIWPFVKKSKTLSDPEALSEVVNDMILDPDFRSNERMAQESDIIKVKNSKKLQSLTPTSEELASLNLKEGRNVVTFNFSTAMLGLQQVDARIYLWKWNTRIVVSDVDGTITKSDVLGQFMPLVGMDWSQTGVAHLFSGIEDNGYQLLFLSARAISQAHLTRQFLFNLKQDGKALPDGPVVISPDGLFPSLYREVIRRAPHEFKISCLEAIRALFPPDCNPFYAGFGNRDTDEISYLKVGIPIGKIFIINPKGQVAVNRRVDTKSYASLHQLVNGIFPPVSSFEQEDYNSWNFWRLPLPDVEI